MRRTIDELAEVLRVDRPAAKGLIDYLIAVKLAVFRGERPSPTGRGKGAHVFEIKNGAGKMAAEMIGTIEG